MATITLTSAFSVSESKVDKETLKVKEEAKKGKNVTRVTNHKNFIEACLNISKK